MSRDTGPARYRKKPVVIEAIELTPWNADEVAQWSRGTPVVIHQPDDQIGVEIKTLEGVMRADVGDWVIRGVQGEFYPCKPDIFDASYEPEPPDAES